MRIFIYLYVCARTVREMRVPHLPMRPAGVYVHAFLRLLQHPLNRTDAAGHPKVPSPHCLVSLLLYAFPTPVRPGGYRENGVWFS